MRRLRLWKRRSLYHLISHQNRKWVLQEEQTKNTTDWWARLFGIVGIAFGILSLIITYFASFPSPKLEIRDISLQFQEGVLSSSNLQDSAYVAFTVDNFGRQTTQITKVTIRLIDDVSAQPGISLFLKPLMEKSQFTLEPNSTRYLLYSITPIVSFKSSQQNLDSIFYRFPIIRYSGRDSIDRYSVERKLGHKVLLDFAHPVTVKVELTYFGGHTEAAATLGAAGWH